MMGMIQDPEMALKFPMIAVMQNKSKKAEGGNEKFMQMLQGCEFEGLLALMSNYHCLLNSCIYQSFSDPAISSDSDSD
jgi:hypothetical protein